MNRKALQNQAIKSGRREHNNEFGLNPCILPTTKFLTKDGVALFSTLSVGDIVWTGTTWSPLIAIWSTGVKSVNKYTTEHGYSISCTNNHRIVQCGKKIEVRDAIKIDIANVPYGGERPTYISDKIMTTEYLGEFEVFDFTVEAEEHTVWANGLLISNCAEIILRGSQFCNLSEVIVRSDDTLDTLRNKVKVAALIGTLQATLTDFRYIRKIWADNTKEEALLGISLTGIMDHPTMSSSKDKEVLKEWLLDLKTTAILENKKFAQILGINQAVAITTVKPSGTVSQLVNSSSGIHPRFSKYYIRRVRMDKKDPISKVLIESGIPCESDLLNDSVYVFGFPIKSPDTAIFVEDVSAIDQLEHWLTYRENWCEHNPSITVYLKEEEWLEAGAWVYKHFDNIGGISFLPLSNHTYKQQPYEKITEAEYMIADSKMPKNIDWDILSKYEEEDMTIGAKELACSAGHCEI